MLFIFSRQSYDFDPYSVADPYHMQSSFEDELYGYASTNSQLPGAVATPKLQNKPTSSTTTTTTTSSVTSALSSLFTKKLPQPSILKHVANKLPPIPGVAPLMETPMETRSDEEAQFSRFNSYDSESVPYSNSNDMTASMYSQPSTKHDITFGNGDGLDEFYEENGDAHTTDISRITVEQNSNFYNFNEDDLDMEEECTDISKLANFKDEQFNKIFTDNSQPQSGATSGGVGVLPSKLTTNYSNDYYDNCQYNYEYAENETDYIASGDIIDIKSKSATNQIYQSNNNNNYATTKPQSSSLNHHQQQPLSAAKQQEQNKTASILGQSKSLLGGLSSMINSGISNLMTTTTTAPDVAMSNYGASVTSTNAKFGGVPYSSAAPTSMAENLIATTEHSGMTQNSILDSYGVGE